MADDVFCAGRVTRPASGAVAASSAWSAGQAAHEIKQHDAWYTGGVRCRYAEGLERALTMAMQVTKGVLPDGLSEVRTNVLMLSQQALNTPTQRLEIDHVLATRQRTDEVARRLATIPDIGPASQRPLLSL